MPRKEDYSYRQGKFKPLHPEKYKGDPTGIIYRSSYELKFMNYCDLNESISEWKSEEFFIPYRSPIDNRIHRYFPDFFIKYKDKEGNMRKVIIEVKPKKDLKMPEQSPKRKTKSWVYSVKAYAVNQAKWSAAREFCADRGYEFRIFTEDELGITR
jgi:hypothetical protein